MKKVSHVLLKIVIIIVGLLLLVILLLQLPFIQNKIKKKVLSVVNAQLEVPLSIDHIRLTFFDHLNVDGIYWGNQADTLLFVDRLSVDIQLFDLLNKKLHVDEVLIKGLKTHIVKSASDSTFNLLSAIGDLNANETKEESTSTTSFSIDLDRVRLSRINVSYSDEVDSMNMVTRFDDFDLKIQTFDINTNKYIIQSVYLEGLWVDLMQSKSATAVAGNTIDTTEEEQTAMPFQIDLTKEIALNNLNVHLDNKPSGQEISVKEACFKLLPEQIDLQHHLVHLKEIDISNTKIEVKNKGIVKTEVSSTKDVSQEPFSFTSIGWDVKLEALNLANNSFRYETYNDTLQQMTESLYVDSLQAQWKSIMLDATHLSAQMNNLSLVLNQTMPLPPIDLQLAVNDQKANIQIESTISNESNVQINTLLNYGSFQRLQDSLDKCDLVVQLKADIQANDLASYIQSLSDKPLMADVHIDTDVKGNLSHLKLQKLDAQINDAVTLKMTGEISEPLDMEKTRGQVTLEKLQINSQKLLAYLPDSLLPSSISFPDSIDIMGNVEGSSKKLSGNINLKSSLGNLQSQLSMDMDSLPGKEFYRAHMIVDSLFLGEIIQKQDTLQYLSLEADAQGSTSDFKNPEFWLKADFTQLGILNYNYQNLHIHGQMADAFFKGEVQVNDPNVAFSFDGEVDDRDTIPHINADFKLDYIYLKALHLMEDSTALSGRIKMALEGKEWNKMKGNMNAYQLNYQTAETSVALDSLVVGMQQMNDSARYHFKSYQLFMQDTLFNSGITFDARLKGQQALFDYSIVSNSGNAADTSNVLIDGNGAFFMEKDSMLLNTSLRWFQPLLPKPLQLQIQASQSRNNQYKISAEGDKIRLNADARLAPENEDMQASVTIDSLDFSLIEPLTNAYFNKFKGHLVGNIQVDGQKDNPNINGSITIRKATINPVAVNTDFKIAEGTINVDNSLFSFQHFPIEDINNNQAFMNGQLDLSTIENPTFDIQFKADQFLLLNQKESSSGNYFGKVIADIDAKISGSQNNPDIQVDVGFNNESDFTYVVISEAAKASSQDDVVQFLTDSTQLAAQDTMQHALDSEIKGMNVTTNIGITDLLDVTLVIDPASSEKLNIVGNGDLSLSIDPSGEQSLSGQYTIKKGYYTLRLYDVIKRDFEIKENSTLRWSGDLLNADADITAIYAVKTSASSLLETVQGQTSDSESSTNNSRITVKVIMHMSGDLLSPDIDFDLELDSQNTNSTLESAVSQLNEDESELNKQVFSLLILNRFTNTNASVAASVSYEIENTARQTLSKLLAQQLNNFSSQYLKGVDVTFDIESYNQTVENQESSRTDFSVDISQKMFNDRLKVTVGGNVAVEENKDQGKTSSGDLTGDFEVEYKLSKDGTYRVKVFNNTEYEDKLNSDVTKTGLSFILVKDFVRFSDLFKKMKKKEKEHLEEN